MDTDKIGIVILAAGGSTRFGEPKQLLQFEGTLFLRLAVDVALSSDPCQVVVVLGQDAAAAKDEIDGLPLKIVVNSDWQVGISSSIKGGLKKLLEDEPELAAVIFMLCDQPFVSRATIANLINNYTSTRKPIVASSYQETLGVPALFAREMFAELMDLKGDIGAKPVILSHAADVCKIDAPEVFSDIDTQADYEKLLTPKL